MLRLLILACLSTLVTEALAQDPFADLPRAHVMVLGTFHFDDPGLDDYKPEFPWDPFTAEHQREIQNVIERLVRFRPTRIGLEWPAVRQTRLDSLYAAYLAGDAELEANERQQLGFQLAKRLGHARVYAIDAAARSYFPDMTQAQYEAHVARLMEGADPTIIARHQELARRYTALHRHDDSLKAVTPLAAYLARENDPARVRISHGQYVIGGFRLGRDDDYLGSDMRTRWYNRNLRIVQNIQRITSSMDDRILVIIGSGHLPIIRHALAASPEYRLVEPAEFLGDARRTP